MIDLLGRTIKVGDILFRYGGGNSSGMYGLIPVVVVEELIGKIKVKSLDARWSSFNSNHGPHRYEFIVKKGTVTETNHYLLYDGPIATYSILDLWKQAINEDDMAFTLEDRTQLAIWLKKGTL